MSRIKFRGVDINGKFVYGLFCRYKICNLICPCIQRERESDNGDYVEYIEINGETLGQFTGLKDKNGVELYEGDIVKADESIGNIVYLDDSFIVDWIINRDFLNDVLKRQITHLQVVGNIYENADIL